MMAQDDRFARHHLIPGWEQERLGTATAIIVGMGALGNEVSRLLALAGIGHLILVDHDTISTSNLSRCALFDETHIGLNKTLAAREPLQRLYPGINIDARPQALVHAVGLAELRDADLVVSCLDSSTARLELAGRCNLVGAIMLDGGTGPWGGEVRPFLTPGGPCYGCTLTPEQRAISDTPLELPRRSGTRTRSVPRHPQQQ